jgi:hypothetical protein
MLSVLAKRMALLKQISAVYLSLLNGEWQE